MQARSLFPDDVSFEPEGLRLHWKRRCAAARYAGEFLAWPAMRDADPSAAPPEIRLIDGRTVFIAAELRARLTDALLQAEVPVLHRPPVWGHLLGPYVNDGYAAVRESVEADLVRWGFSARETRRIRRRVLMRAMVSSFLAGARTDSGQSDVLLARFALPPLPTPWFRYRRFREWTDAIADRPTAGGQR